MQLKRLLAYGFKSFGDKTEIDFSAGITAIVGPNGSGKSNITDAIRWVLGEQNVHSLRAAKSEDIIFSGSAARRPLSVAEVSLVFDNTDGTLPVDYQEVVVTRRLYRSGESEFRLNQRPCRLKDIYALFADTGIGHEGMSIIGQNRIDDILNARPEERRAYFEETAGITKYKARKKETLKKLDSTEQNLVRVGDILQEIEQQLEPLARHAEKTRLYQELAAEEKKLDLTALSQQHSDLTGKEKNARDALSAKQDERLALETATQKKEAERERTQKAVLDQETAIQEKSQSAADLQEKMQSAEAELAMLRERKENSADAHASLKKRQQALTAALTTDVAAIGQLAGTIAKQKKQQAENEKTLASQQEKAKKLAALLDQQQAETNAALQNQQTAQKACQQKEQELAVLQKDIELGDEGQKEREAQLAAAKKQQEELARELQRYDAQKAAKQQELTLLGEKRKAQAAALAKAQEAQATLAKAQTAAREARQNTKNRLHILKNMQESYEGFRQGTRAVLKSHAPWRRGVCGAVAELMRVPKPYVLAIEVALSGSQQHIVTEDEHAAKAAIAFLKEKRLGRVTFLPLSTLVVRRPADEEAQQEAGAIGFASDLVEATEEKYRPALDFLLARTLVVDTLDHALAIARKYQQRLRIVTLGGELLSPGGSLTGGSQRHQEASFLGRSGEIDTLTKALQTAEQKAEKEAQQLAAAEQRTTQSKTQLQAIDTALQQTNLALAGLLAARKRTAAVAGDAQTALAELQQTHAHAQDSFAAKQRSYTQLKEDVRTTEAAAKAAAKIAQQKQDELADLREDAGDLQRLQQEQEMQQAVLAASLARDTDQLAHRREEKEAHEQELRALEQEESDLTTRERESAARFDSLTQTSGTLAEKLDTAKREQNDLYAAKMELLAASQRLQKELEKLARSRAKLLDQLKEKEISLARLEDTRKDIEEKLLTAHGLTPERARECALDLAPEEIARQQTELREKLDALGPVNPNAVTEYEELKKRHDFLTAQTQDLRDAEANLTALLTEMDEKMSTQFRDAFTKIQEYFADSFSRLLGGGKAELLLLDKEDILNTGIDILVTLPQKKRQNLAALSGGERALTVVALLFAFLRYRPSPFSVLDEIDAPLDEANVVRFGHYLKDLATDTQFIVVTHRKGTMEAASTLYGVTTQEAGVSKILSIKLDEIKE